VANRILQLRLIKKPQEFEVSYR